MFRSILCRSALILAAAAMLVVAIAFSIWAAFLMLIPYFGILTTVLIFAAAFALLAAAFLLTAWLMGRAKGRRTAPESPGLRPDDLIFELGRSLGANMDPLLAFGVAAVVGFVLGRRM